MTSGGSPDLHPGWHEPLPARLPRPTPVPAVAALGACLLAFGVETSWVVSAVGLAVFAAGIAGWVGEMRHGRQG